MERVRHLAPFSGTHCRPCLSLPEAAMVFVISWVTQPLGKTCFQNFFPFVASSASFWRRRVLSAIVLTLHGIILLSLLACTAAALQLPRCNLQSQRGNKPWQQGGDQMSLNHHFLILGCDSNPPLLKYMLSCGSRNCFQQMVLFSEVLGLLCLLTCGVSA